MSWSIQIEVVKLRHAEFLDEARRDALVKSLPPEKPGLLLTALRGMGVWFEMIGQWLQRSSMVRTGVTSLLVLLLAGCYTAVVRAAPLTTLPGSNVSGGVAAHPGWQSYHDPVSGVFFELPQGWLINEPVLAVKNMSNRYQVMLSSQAADGAQVELDVFKSTAGTLTEVVAQQKLQRIKRDPSLVIVDQASWTLPWRQPAIYLQLTGEEGASALLITTRDGKTVILSGIGDLNQFQMIAQTLRIKSSVAPT